MLVVHMPEELQTREELVTFISSPQFRQTIDSLATVLSSEQMYQILASMGISPSAAPFPGGEGFLQALIATLSKKESADAKPAGPAPPRRRILMTTCTTDSISPCPPSA